ncbi:sufe-like protein 2, partial [Quercus suber]
MVSGPTTTTLSLSSSSSFLFGFSSLKFSQRTRLKFIDNVNERKFAFAPLQCIRVSGFDSCSALTAIAPSSELVSDKLHRLATEFRALHEPIDRVKRLLHYAAILPPADESRTRAPENRVTGCTTQVWVEAELDESGRVRFLADSDSEISKGFCSCLIYVLDGADPEEVAMVEADDLSDLNVGLHGKSHSRVNTWHNVLVAMQKRTKALLPQQPQLQGVLSINNCGEDLTSYHKMAKAECQFITVLSVDFIWENVRSCIHVPSQGSCSFISFACYICKHLGRIKARAHELTPTITCTSSNAVQTILKWMAIMGNEEVAEIYPGHHETSIVSQLPCLHYYH